MKIGDLAAATATQVETIRFYEREGLIPAPARTAANYRTYDQTHIERLVFIRKCRSLDMALDEVRSLLMFKDAPTSDCTDVNDLLDEHIVHVATRIAELQALEQELKALRARCHAPNAGAACEILKELSDNSPQEKAASQRQAHQHIGILHRAASRSAKRHD